MKAVFSGCVVLLMVLAGVPAHALEDLVLYDNFNAKLIDPDKWFGSEFGEAGTETVRQIKGKRLRLVSRSYGNTDSNSGTRLTGFLLNFIDRPAVTAIEATVQVKKVEVAGCSSNTDATRSQASLSGNFFNTGTPIPGNQENDVLASIGVWRQSNSIDPPDVLRVVSSVFRCGAPCVPGTSLHFRDLGPVNKGQSVRLRIQWDPDNDRFIFQRDEEPEVFAPYTVSDTAPPGLLNKRLEVAHNVANCTAEPRPVGFMEALFDDVFVNESALP